MSFTYASSKAARLAERLLPTANLARLLADAFWEPVAFSEAALGHLKAACEAFGPLGTQRFTAFTGARQTAPGDLTPLYCKLFLGPFELLAAPYASVYLEGDESSMGVTRRRMLDLYAQGGYDLPPRAGDLPDHLAVELEFLYLSLAERHQSGDELALERAGVLLDHLADWLPLWQQQISQYAEAEYYVRLGDLAALLPETD